MSNKYSEKEKRFHPSLHSNRRDKFDVVENHLSTLNAENISIHDSANIRLISYRQGSDVCKLAFVNEDKFISMPNSPVFAFIHGGYWSAMKYSDYFTVTKAFREFFPCVLIGYDVCPGVTFDELVDEIFQAIRRLFTDERCKNRKIYLCGHSAGAHLAAYCIFTFFLCKSEFSSVVKSNLGGLILLMGIYDMRPFEHFTINDPLKLDSKKLWKYSPLRLVKQLKSGESSNLKVLVHHAEFDAPGLIEQSVEFEKALKSNGVSCRLAKVDGFDHFLGIEKLSDKTYPLFEMIKQFMLS